jgi:hypothetical protein
MLILVAPAGLERFFEEIGREAVDDDPRSGAVTPEDVARLLASAQKYGLEILKPDH